MRALLIALILLLTFSVSLNVSQCRSSREKDGKEYRDTITTTIPVYDTIPVPRDSVILRYSVTRLPLAFQESRIDTLRDTILTIVRDSMDVVIPITQKKYETEEYRAYVSGYEARLDSCITFNRSHLINIRSPTSKPSRFAIGLQGGYGITPKGFQPYIGIGIAVNLYSF